MEVPPPPPPLDSQSAKIRPSSVKLKRMQVSWDKSAHLSSPWDMTITKCSSNICTYAYISIAEKCFGSYSIMKMATVKSV